MPLDDTNIQLIAHRGYQRHYPENTLLALEKAIEAGGRYLEVDIQLSNDNQAVLYHDRDLKRISAQKGAIRDYSFDELLKFSAHEPERFGNQFIAQKITPLQELVDLLIRHREVHCFVEIKRICLKTHSSTEILNILANYLEPVLAQVTLISFSIEVIQQAKETGWSNYGVVLSEWQQTTSPTLLALEPAFVFADIDFLPHKGELTIPGGKLAVYDVCDPKKALQLAARNVQYIETFAIGEMISALGKQES